MVCRPGLAPWSGLGVSGAAPDGSLGSFTLVGTTLRGIRPAGTAARAQPAGSVSSPFLLFSHPSRKQKTRIGGAMQWEKRWHHPWGMRFAPPKHTRRTMVFLNGRIGGWKGTVIEAVFCPDSA